MWRAWTLAPVLLTLSAASGRHRVYRASGPRDRGEWPHCLAGHRLSYRRTVDTRHSTRSVHVYVGAQETQGTAPDVSAGGLQAHASVYPNVTSAVGRSLAASPVWRTPPALFLPLVYHRLRKHTAAMAPWSLDLALLGTDQRQQPLRVVINTRLPNAPAAPLESSAATPERGLILYLSKPSKIISWCVRCSISRSMPHSCSIRGRDRPL